MIRFACLNCGMQLSAPEECAGRSSKCRGCGQLVTVPAPSVRLLRGLPRWALPAACAAALLLLAGGVLAWSLSRTAPARSAWAPAPGGEGGAGQDGKQEGDGAKADKDTPKKTAGDAPKDDMRFQQLEDRLNAGGLRVSRVASRRVRNAMWFGDGLRGTHPDIVDTWEEVGHLYRTDCIRVTKVPDSKQAIEWAAKVADIQQRPIFAWGPFLFEGTREALDNAKAALEGKPLPREAPETKLERLRMVLKESEREDVRYEDQIARLHHDVEKLEATVNTKEQALTQLKQEIADMDAQVAGKTATLIEYKGKERLRRDVEEQVQIDSRNYLDGQKALTADKDLLRIKRETLQQSQQHLREMGSNRTRMLARLQEIENALLKERSIHPLTLSQFTKDIDTFDDNVKLMQKRRELQPGSSIGPIREAESREKKDVEVDNFLKDLRRPAPVARPAGETGGSATSR